MKLIDVIPIGKEHRKTRKELMHKIQMEDIKLFQSELSKLRKSFIILYDDGYYLPSSKEEYLEFIDRQKEQLNSTEKTIKLAYRKMEEL